MVYGIIQLINFAHGEVVMIGAMVAFTVINALAPAGLPPLLVVTTGTACAVPVCMLVGYSMERLAYRPLRRAPRLAPLITAIGVSIILQHLAMLVWSRNVLAFPQIIPTRTFTFFGATITGLQLAIIGICVAMMTALALLVYRTDLGTAMRATAQNQQVAGLMGININRVIAFTFVIGAALGAVAGVLFGTYYGVAQYTMGSILGLKAFSAAVLGGIGNIPGAMLGGILLGIVEALGAGYIGDLSDLCSAEWIARFLPQHCEGGGHFILFGSNYQDVFAFLVLILVLVLRPSGLLGERVGERA
jgi:branched-chain amino acid transport system permease protein